MESRRAVFAVVMLALVSVNMSVEVDGDAVAQLGEGGKPPTSVSVEVSPTAPKAPEPTIATLLPKQLKRLTGKFMANNGGKAPTVRDNIELKRLAVLAAAKEITDSQQSKDALEKANRMEARLNRRLKHDYKTIFKVEQNQDYAARKAYVRADMQVQDVEKAANKLKTKVEKKKENAAMYRTHDENASGDRKHMQGMVDKAKGEYDTTQLDVEKAREYVDNAKSLILKRKARKENKAVDVKKWNNFLDNIEVHEAKARLEYRQAKITKEFEMENARKVGMLLSSLTAKRDAIKRFTKSLGQKATLDFKAARAGIAKAKADYNGAKAKYDEFTQKAGEAEEKYQETLRIIEHFKMQVVNAIDSGNSAAAIQGAEKHKSLLKHEVRDQKDVRKWDLKAKTKQLMMNAAISDLNKAEALETVARKQKDMVKEHRVTMKAQNQKIAMLTTEVKKHTDAGKEAAKKAKAAYYKVKGMRKKARFERNDAQAQERYAEHIGIPMAKRMEQKANLKYNRVNFKSKNEADNLSALQKAKTQITIRAMKSRKELRNGKASLKQAIKFSQAKQKVLAKAEAKRDETLAHNRKKMKEMKARLKEAEAHFAKATGEPAPKAPALLR